MALWGETISTVRNVSNVSLEDVYPRFLLFNREWRNRLSIVSGVHYHRLARARLRSLLSIIVIFACFPADIGFFLTQREV